MAASYKTPTVSRTPSLVPDQYIVDLIRRFQRENAGQQEDAQEFLTFLLDQLHEEIVAVAAQHHAAAPSWEANGEQWVEVSKSGVVDVDESARQEHTSAQNSLVRVCVWIFPELQLLWIDLWRMFSVLLWSRSRSYSTAPSAATSRRPREDPRQPRSSDSRRCHSTSMYVPLNEFVVRLSRPPIVVFAASCRLHESRQCHKPCGRTSARRRWQRHGRLRRVCSLCEVFTHAHALFARRNCAPRSSGCLPS